jgi:hypothetical protein
LLILELSTSQEIKIVLFFCFASLVSLLKSIGDHRGELPYYFFPCITNVDLIAVDPENG